MTIFQCRKSRDWTLPIRGLAYGIGEFGRDPGIAIPSYISTNLKRKLRDNTGVIDYFAGDSEINEYKPKMATVKDIDIVNSLGQIDIVSISAKAISTHLYYVTLAKKWPVRYRYDQSHRLI